MIDLQVVLLTLVAHFIADFVLQWHAVAMAKSSSNVALTKHIIVYTWAFWCIWLGAGLIVVGSGLSIVLVTKWALLNGALHWCVDWVTSRWCKRLHAAGRTHDFFVVIGLDQLIHYVCLFTTLMWLL